MTFYMLVIISHEFEWKQQHSEAEKWRYALLDDTENCQLAHKGKEKGLLQKY